MPGFCLFRFTALPVLLLAAALTAQGQHRPTAHRPTHPKLPPPPADTAQVYDYVEQMPQPPGGMEGLMQYLGKNFRYPLTCGYITDKIFVAFVVQTDGRISNVHVTKPTHHSLDAEAVRVIRQMLPWTPGRQGGQPVKVAYTVPITICLK